MITIDFLPILLLEFSDSLVDAFSYEVHVGGREAAHADAAVLEEVDVLLLQEVIAHFGRKAGEGKHADLKKNISTLGKSCFKGNQLKMRFFGKLCVLGSLGL